MLVQFPERDRRPARSALDAWGPLHLAAPCPPDHLSRGEIEGIARVYLTVEHLLSQRSSRAGCAASWLAKSACEPGGTGSQMSAVDQAEAERMAREGDGVDPMSDQEVIAGASSRQWCERVPGIVGVLRCAPDPVARIRGPRRLVLVLVSDHSKDIIGDNIEIDVGRFIKSPNEPPSARRSPLEPKRSSS